MTFEDFKKLTKKEIKEITKNLNYERKKLPVSGVQVTNLDTGKVFQLFDSPPNGISGKDYLDYALVFISLKD